MIISLIQTKGGTGKTTLAKCLAYSRAFRRVFSSVCFVELDTQGTVSAWHKERVESGHKKGKTEFVSLAGYGQEEIKNKLTELVKSHDTIILDVPGESVGKFATKFAMALSDIVLIPMRSSTNDEQSFEDNILPVIEQTIQADQSRGGSFFVLPAFTHPQANYKKIREYFLSNLPGKVGCLNTCFPHRSVFENFSRDGLTLIEYANSVKSNSRYYNPAKKAVGDIETIAKEVLKRAG